MSRNSRGQAGYTLLEVVIASSIFALLIALIMGMLGRAMGSAEMDLSQTFVEDQVQNAVDSIIDDLKETSPAKVTFYQFAENGRPQTAICFPSARDVNGQFIYKVAGQVQSSPVWQCVRVYCFCPGGGGNGGWIRRFEDYSLRSYTNPISVTSVTTTQIKLSDGTIFQRNGTSSGNQRMTTVPGYFVQMESAVPADEGPADFTLDPDLVEFAIQDQELRPLRLTIRAEVEHKYPTLRGGSVITTLTNEVLSRNRN
jgi:prepilin-type N-terminal cleavage/methylation domain-containing protein